MTVTKFAANFHKIPGSFRYIIERLALSKILVGVHWLVSFYHIFLNVILKNDILYVSPLTEKNYITYCIIFSSLEPNAIIFMNAGNMFSVPNKIKKNTQFSLILPCCSIHSTSDPHSLKRWESYEILELK